MANLDTPFFGPESKRKIQYRKVIFGLSLKLFGPDQNVMVIHWSLLVLTKMFRPEKGQDITKM